MLIAAIQPPADAQQDSGAAPLEARLHIGEDGRITILNGKIEEGQGPRTELAMAAAEELRVPLSQIAVQMADTDTTPNDWITAGSRTTPGYGSGCSSRSCRRPRIADHRCRGEMEHSPAEVAVNDGVAVSGEPNAQLSRTGEVA